MTSIKDLLAEKAKRPERTVHVCVAADLVDRHRTLSAELADLLEQERQGGTSIKRLAAQSPARVKAEEVRAVEEAMAEATVEVHLRGVEPAEWRKWRNENPARDGVSLDDALGLNSDALMTDMVRRCIVSPEFDDEDWATWCAEVANAEQQVCAIEVLGMHERRVDIPKSPVASLVTAMSDDDSTPRLASE